jgi:hypothetical protein
MLDQMKLQQEVFGLKRIAGIYRFSSFLSRCSAQTFAAATLAKDTNVVNGGLDRQVQMAVTIASTISGSHHHCAVVDGGYINGTPSDAWL